MFYGNPQTVSIDVDAASKPWDTRKGTGWFAPPPSPKNKDWNEQKVYQKLKGDPINSVATVLTADDLPKEHDLTKFCTPVKDQNGFGACTGYAATAAAELMYKVAYGENRIFSDRYAYNNGRWLMKFKGDTGCFNRAVMGGMVQFGISDQKRYPFKSKWEDFDKGPGARVLCAADDQKIDAYFRHDNAEMPKECVETSIKKYLTINIPAVIGFYGTPSWNAVEHEGDIAAPDNSGEIVFGHAVCLVGYNDEYEIKNLDTGRVSVGAFKFKNPWGKAWGFKGYGWIPYDYMRWNFAQDDWSMLSVKWLETGQFGY